MVLQHDGAQHQMSDIPRYGYGHGVMQPIGYSNIPNLVNGFRMCRTRMCVCVCAIVYVRNLVVRMASAYASSIHQMEECSKTNTTQNAIDNPLTCGRQMWEMSNTEPRGRVNHYYECNKNSLFGNVAESLCVCVESMPNIYNGPRQTNSTGRTQANAESLFGLHWVLDKIERRMHVAVAKCIIRE